MNTKHISLAFAASAALLAGCAKSPFNEVKSLEQLADLELSYIGATETKVAIDGTTFPEEGEIGLFLFKDEEAKQPYGESGYSNVKYSYDSSKGKWTSSPSIKVGGETGYLYGYYPYSSEAADIKSVPVSSSLNGDDVMYATKKTVTDQTAPQTAITMNHALARVSITVIKKDYTGDAKLTNIKLSGAEIAPTGTLNALDGTITAEKSDVTLDVTGDDQIITAAGTAYKCLLVPSKAVDDKQSMTLALTIDGVDKEAELTVDNGVIIAKGTKSNITITLSNTGIIVQAVSVENWNVVEVEEHNVTIKLSEDEDDIDDDVLARVKVDDNTVEILAYSLSGKRLECILTGTAEVSRDIDRVYDSYTFTISDIGSDVTATIGYEEPLKVTVTSNNSEWGSATFKGKCYEDETITFTATANDGFEFAEWQDADGNKLDWENPQKVILTSDLAVKAVFKISGILPGVFTVGKGADGIAGTADDVKVQFSKGNLYYVPADKSFYFETNQYDVKYEYKEGYRETEDHIGHFYWSSKGSVAYSFSHYPPDELLLTDVFFTNDSDDQTKPNSDFCANGLKGFWRVLSGGENGEWAYLLNDRDGNRFAKAKVHNMAGLLIFPDGYTLPSGYSSDGGTGMSKVNGKKELYPSNNIPDDTGNKIWSEMEAAGVVFLPAAGYRNGISPQYSQPYDVLNHFLDSGYYWTSSLYTKDGTQAHSCFFTDSQESYAIGVDPIDRQYRGLASSVRLVIDCK